MTSPREAGLTKTGDLGRLTAATRKSSSTWTMVSGSEDSTSGALALRSESGGSDMPGRFIWKAGRRARSRRGPPGSSTRWGSDVICGGRLSASPRDRARGTISSCSFRKRARVLRLRERWRLPGQQR